jgi:hypothetical protein
VRIFSGKAAEELLVGKNSGADSYYILLTKKGVVAETSDANLPAKFDMGPFLSGAGDGK